MTARGRRGHGERRRAFEGAGTAGGAPPAFTPTDLGASLLGWWDASDAASLSVNTDGTGGTPIADQAVGRINDKSGNARHLRAGALATPADNARPVRKAAQQNGLDTLLFDGVDDRIVTAAFSSAETHYYVVARHAGTTGGLFGRNNGGAYDWIYKPTGDTALANFGAGRGGSGAQLNNAAVFPATTAYGLFRLSIVPGSAGTTNVDLRRDEASYATSTVAIGSTPWSASLVVGSTEPTTAANFANMYLAEMVVASTLDARVAAYLKAKWGTP